MRLLAKAPFFSEAVRIVREALPQLSLKDASAIAEGTVSLEEADAEKILAATLNLDEIFELV